MLDQSFSSENFRKILEVENRKGIYLEGEFYPSIATINRQIKEINEKIKGLRQSNLSKEEMLKEREGLSKQKEDFKEKRKEKLAEELDKVSSRVTTLNYKFGIKPAISTSSKFIYRADYTLENILILKQIQYNLRKLYKVKQSSRYAIISQLRRLLDDGFPKVVLKTDIQGFYESISQEALLKRINNDNLLTHLSIKFIQQILKNYQDISGSSKGVPRGIGISPYLAELYMRDTDTKMKSLPNLLYYARYVDDIILIFIPDVTQSSRDYQNEVKEILENEGLSMNMGKTRLFDLLDRFKDQAYSFDYLGYRFTSGYKNRKHIPLVLTISERKKKRYAARLLKALQLYKEQAKGNEKMARKLLVKRLRFLTSNTRLTNNKRRIITGVYYTNNLINNTDDLKVLDRFLQLAMKKFALPVQLFRRISSASSFVKGFNPTRISRFSTIELKSIMSSWTR